MLIVAPDEVVQKLSRPGRVTEWPVRLSLMLKSGRLVPAIGHSPTRIDTSIILEPDEVIDVVIEREQ